MDTPLEFDGPANFHCMGVQYRTLTHGGVKEEGAQYPGGVHDKPDEAWDQFRAIYAEYVKDVQQIAWRRRPELIEERGRFAVTCRLARYPQDLPA